MKKSLWCICCWVLMLMSSLYAGEKRLNVPYYWQSNTGLCWAAAVCMVAKYYNEIPIAGTQIKPWWIAAQLNIDPDEGGNFYDQVNALAILDPVRNYSYVLNISKNSIVNNIQNNNPVILKISDYMIKPDGKHAMHGIVAVGYNDNEVMLNDPSGSFTEKIDTHGASMAYVKVDWDTFFDAIDISDAADGHLIYPDTDYCFLDFSKDFMSFDFCPSYGYYDIPVKKSGIESRLIKNNIKLHWGDIDYYYKPKLGHNFASSSVRPSTDNFFSAMFYYQDIIELYPFMTSFTDHNKTVYFDIFVYNDGEQIIEKRSPTVGISQFSHKFDYLIDTIPVNDFYHKLTKDECYLKVICREHGTDIEQDRVEMFFSVYRKYKLLTIQSEPNGVNIDLNYSDINGHAGALAPYTRQYPKGIWLNLTAPATHSGWRFTEWQKNGQTYSTNSNIQIRVDDDATYKAVYEVLDSELYVSGSSSPEIFSLSGRSSQGWNNIRIPVYNRKSTTVDVNVTKSGNAANWVKLIDGASFQLSGNEMKIYLISISIPSSADPGIYSAYVSFNGIAQEFYITVSESTSEITFPFRTPRGNINGDWTWQEKPFLPEMPVSWIDIRGNTTFNYSFTLTPEEILNVDSFRLSAAIKKMTQYPPDLLCRLNNHTLYTFTRSANPQIDYMYHYIFDRRDEWCYLIGGNNSYTFHVNPLSSTDTTLYWQVLHGDEPGIGFIRTNSVWQSEKFEIPSSQWYDMQDKFLNEVQVIAKVDSVGRAGSLRLYVNETQPRFTSINPNSNEITWYLTRSQLLQYDNVFTIKPQTFDTEYAHVDKSGTGTIASLSNIRLYMHFNTEIPNLELTKSISPNPVLAGQEATVKITISNPTEYSSTGDSTSLIDAALPAGLVLTSGRLSDSSFAEKLEEGDSEEHTYRIKADVPGYYTLGSANFSWDNFEGDEMELNSNLVVLEVRGGGLAIASGFEERKSGDDLVIDFSATVTANQNGAIVENATVMGSLYSQDGDVWLPFGEPVTLAYDPLTGDFSGTSRIIDRRGNYKAVLTAQCPFYDDGISTPYFFIPDLPVWQTTQITNDGVTTVMIISYSGDGGAIDIPAQINGYSVTAIGDRAMQNCSSLTAITIPHGVTNIGNEAFADCSNLISAIMPEGLLTISNSAFFNCFNLRDIAIPDTVTNIGNWAFAGCSMLQSVVFGNNLRHIGDYAFNLCDALQTVTFGNGPTNIGDFAFGLCIALQSVTFGDDEVTIGENAFSLCSALQTVTFGNGPTSIGFGAFDCCENLQLLAFGDGEVTIGDFAFDSCIALQTVTFGDGDITIGDFAFDSCIALQTVTFGNGDVTIGNFAFSDCYVLQTVTFGDGEVTIGEHAFAYLPALQTVTFGNGPTNIGDGAFYCCENLRLLAFGDGEVMIGYVAFLACTSLTSVVIPASVTIIGEGAFYDCLDLTSVYFSGQPPEIDGTHDVFDNVAATAYYISGVAGWGDTFGGLPASVWTTTATFEGNGGTLSFTERTYNVGNAYGVLPTASRSGYVFAGWWAALDEGSTEVTTSTLVPLLTTGHTLQAKWMEIPTVPTGVSASGGTYTGKVRVSWDNVSGATSYEIWRHTINNPNMASKLDGNPSTSPYDDNTAVAGQTYYYWVKSKNAAGTSDFSLPDTGYRQVGTILTGYENAHNLGRIPNIAHQPASNNQWIVYSGQKTLTSAATQNWFKFVGNLGKRYVFSAKDITNNNPGVEITFELFGSELIDDVTTPFGAAYRTITSTGFDALDRGILADMPAGTDTDKTYFVRISHAASAISEITYTLKVHEAPWKPAAGAVTNPHWTGALPGQWTMDRAAAETQSLVDGKPVIYLFSGLLWCPYCVGMDHQVLQTPAFATATANAYLVVLDNQYRDDTGPSLLRDNTTGGYQKTHNILDDGAAKLTDNIAVQNALALPTATLWGPAGDNQRKKIGYPTLVYCVPEASPTRATVNGLASVGRISDDYEADSVIAKLADLAAMAAAGFVEDNNYASTSSQALAKDSPESSRIGGNVIAADWWRFTVPADKTVEITATGSSVPAGAAISLKAYAADGVTLLKTATAPATAPVRLVFAPTINTEAADYLLQVTSTGASASFPYTLKLVETAKTYVLSMADLVRNVSKNDTTVKFHLNIETVNGNELPIAFKCRLRFPGDEGAGWQEFTIAHADKATPYTFSMALPDFEYPDGDITELVAEIIESADGGCQIDPEKAATTVNVLGYATFNYPAEATFTLYKDVAITPGSLSFPIIGGNADGESVNYDPDLVPPGLKVDNLTNDPDNPRVEITGTPKGEANDEYTLWLILMPSKQDITLTFVLKDLPAISKAFAGYLVRQDDDTAAQAIRGDIKIDNDLDGASDKITVRIATQDTKAASVFEFTAWSSYSPDPGTLNLEDLTGIDDFSLSLQIGLDDACTGTYTSPLGNVFAIHASAKTEDPTEYEGYYTVALRHWIDGDTYACQGWLQVTVDNDGLVTYQGELIDGTTFDSKDTYVTPGNVSPSSLSSVPDGELIFFLPLGWSPAQNKCDGRLTGRLTIVSLAERKKIFGDNNDAWVDPCDDSSVWEKSAQDPITLDPCGTVFDKDRSVAEQVNQDPTKPYFYFKVVPATVPATAGMVMPNYIMLEEKRSAFTMAATTDGILSAELGDLVTMAATTDGILSAELGDLEYGKNAGTFTGTINVLKTADGSASGALGRAACAIRGILTPITSDCCRPTANLAVGHGYFTHGGTTYLVTIVNDADHLVKTTQPTIAAFTPGDPVSTPSISSGTYFVSTSENNTVQLSVPFNAKILRRQVGSDKIFLHSTNTNVLIINQLPALSQEFTAVVAGREESDKAILRLYRQNNSLITFKMLSEGTSGDGMAPLRRGWNLIGIPQNFRTGNDASKEIAVADLGVPAGVALVKYDQDEKAYMIAETLTAGEACWMFVDNDDQAVTLPGVLLLAEDYTKETPAAYAWQFVADPGQGQDTRWFWVDGQFTTEPPAQPAWHGVWWYYSPTN